MTRRVAAVLARADAHLRARKAHKAPPRPHDEDDDDAFLRVGLAMMEDNHIPDPLGRHREPRSIDDKPPPAKTLMDRNGIRRYRPGPPANIPSIRAKHWPTR